MLLLHFLEKCLLKAYFLIAFFRKERLSMGQLKLEQQTLMATNRVEEFFMMLYGNTMRSFPKRASWSLIKKEKKFDKERQWVFFGSKEKMKSMATHYTLFAAVGDTNFDSTYYTPNGYYRRDRRLTENLRWLNAFVFDLDTKGETLIDVMDRIHQAGLPVPTAVVKTPSGGYHVSYFFKENVRATPRAINLYTAIMRHIAIELGADLAAVGANRIFRTPTQENLIYFNPVKYDFDLFKDWREINFPFDPKKSGRIDIHTDIMSHPALRYLLESPCPEGQRDQTAFTLALAMKASKWPQNQAEQAILTWFYDHCARGSRGSRKKPFTERDALYKVNYVYYKDSLLAPAASIIRELSGMPFYYMNRAMWDQAKPRHERVRVHLDEWKDDLMSLVKKEREIIGTQKEIAEMLNCPMASFKEILRQLKDQGAIIVETKRGRGGNTVIKLPENPSGESSVEKELPENIIIFPISKLKKSTNQQDTYKKKVAPREITEIKSGKLPEEDPEGPD